jgi:hypothetical protein
MSAALDALDRIDTIAACLEAVRDLASPETDLHLVSREKFSILLDFLMVEHRAASEDLAKALRSGNVASPSLL